MLSEDKIAILGQKVSEWAQVENVPANIQTMVLTIGAENPQTDEEYEKVLTDNLWSDAVLGWYDKFTNYLEAQQQPTAKPQPDLLLSLRTLRQLLDQIIEQVEQNG